MSDDLDRADQEAYDRDLDPGRVTTGAGKRLNNRGLMIAFALGGIFLFFLFWVVYDKSQTQGNYGGTETRKTDNAENMASQITADAPSGMVPPAGSKTEKEEPPQEKKEPEMNPAVPDFPDFQVASDLNNPPPPPRLSEDERRVRQLKIQMFEQALFSKTNVPVEGYAGSSGGARPKPEIPSGGSGYQVDEIKARLAETRARLARLQSSGGEQNVTQAYQERLAVLRGETGTRSDFEGQAAMGVAGDSPATGGDRWLLQNNKGPDQDPVDRPRTKFEVRAGGVIPATLISGINSDLPGQIIGQTTQAVYDTATGKHLVIPQGTRLIGMYESQVIYGQERVLIVWQRLIFPDGKALDLGSMPGGDAQGYSGFHDQVNTHFWRTIGSAFLMSGVIAGVSLSQPVTTGDTQRASDALSEALGQTLGQALSQMILKNLNVAPTLEIRPGYRFNVIVTKDIPFVQPYKPF